jgi:hypothetical protein
MSCDERNLQTTGTINNKETQRLAYADDIDIVGRSQSAKVGLKINEQKTKYMIAAIRNDRTIRNVEQSVAIGDKHFEVVKEFVYLGSLMTPTNDVSLEMQRRTSAVEPPFTPHKIHHLQDLDLPSPALRQ